LNNSKSYDLVNQQLVVSQNLDVNVQITGINPAYKNLQNDFCFKKAAIIKMDRQLCEYVMGT
jgi:hypothetical protein